MWKWSNTQPCSQCKDLTGLKTWLHQGKTKHAGLSSHSGSPLLATKGKQAKGIIHFKPYKTPSESYSLSMLCTGFQWGLALLQTHSERGIKSQSNGSDRLYPTCVVWTHHLAEESVLNWLHIVSYQAHLKTAGRAVGFFRGGSTECDRMNRRRDTWDNDASKNSGKAIQQKTKSWRLAGRDNMFCSKTEKHS